ncbi:hypothetical protein Sm713_29860 [Streptomyces sp. TS71-3]|nr:hypothetical protein Sm713_29860 [Streptomyces sp. TS71-3]
MGRVEAPAEPLVGMPSPAASAASTVSDVGTVRVEPLAPVPPVAPVALAPADVPAVLLAAALFLADMASPFAQ